MLTLSRNSFLLALLIVLLACNSPASYRTNNPLIGQWRLDKVVFDDGTANQMSGDNSVEFQQIAIVETISGHGKRRYPYTREDRVLILTVGDEQVEWHLIERTHSALRVRTPIGVYVLSRE